MQPEWLRLASGPGMWIIGFIFAGSALVQSYLFYRLAVKTSKKLQMPQVAVSEALKASFITSIGPALGSFMGMTVLVIALGGAYAFQRESAGVGSIMYELIAARNGAEAAGVALTREAMTPGALAIVAWTAALGSFGWVLLTALFSRNLGSIKNAIGGGNTTRLGMVSVAIMLAAFARMFANDAVKPFLATGKLAALVTGIVGGVVALAWLLWCDRAKKPALKEYFVLAALLIGMTAGQLTRLIQG